MLLRGGQVSPLTPGTEVALSDREGDAEQRGHLEVSGSRAKECGPSSAQAL